MAKFSFGKNKGKDTREEELREDELGNKEELEDVKYNTGFDDEDVEFFDDDFGTVVNPRDDDDLEAEAREYAKAHEAPKYDKAEPKWYEKGMNIIITIVIITVVIVSGLYVFREPIRGLIGAGTEELRDLDIQGQVSDYGEGVKETLKGTEDEEDLDEEQEVIEVVDVESVSDGEYTVGVDIKSGTWVAKDVLVDIYNTKEDFDEKKNPRSSNIKYIDVRSYMSLSDGQYVVVQGGELVNNATRPETKFNIGDTGILIEDEHYMVGKDLPEGFYTLHNANILDTKEGRTPRGATLEVINARDEDPSSIGVERKTTVFLKIGYLLAPDSDIIIERVSADGTHGDDLDILTSTEDEHEEQSSEEQSSEE